MTFWLVLLAAFMMWVMWICAFIHQIYRLREPQCPHLYTESSASMIRCAKTWARIYARKLYMGTHITGQTASRRCDKIFNISILSQIISLIIYHCIFALIPYYSIRSLSVSSSVMISAMMHSWYHVLVPLICSLPWWSWSYVLASYHTPRSNHLSFETT